MKGARQSSEPPVPASTVLLVRESPLQVLMVRRGAGAIFSSALVFPGGVVDAADRSDDWLPHVQGAAALEPFERALRIAACRELFEETAVLMSSPPAQPAAGVGYLETIRQLGARAPLDALVPFGHWITPEGVGKRFDTYFYICRAPTNAEVTSDGREIVAAEWVRPEEVIERAARGERSIMFPTLLNLRRLLESADVAGALAAAAARQMVTVVPTIERRADGRYIVIPASAGYGITEQRFDR
jgi:8-oxo-dGTP pyrophosphatase MutT (NUDIX family)